MSICIRKNAGMCLIDYRDNIPGTNSFAVGAAPGTAAAETVGCTIAAVLIPRVPLYAATADTFLGKYCIPSLHIYWA